MLNLGLSGEGRSHTVSLVVARTLHDSTNVSSQAAVFSSFLLSWVVDNICGNSRSRGRNPSIVPVFVIAPTELEN